MNKYCVAFTKEEYEESIRLLRSGFRDENGYGIKPNEKIAVIVTLQATLGLRIGDVLRLRLADVIKDGDRYRLNINEDKTDKPRRFTVPTEVYVFMQNYAIENRIGADLRLFPISSRQVERHLNKVFRQMGLNTLNYGTHSYRKYFSLYIYENNNHDIALVQTLLQHSSPSTTRRYITISEDRIETALESATSNLVL